MMRSRGGETWVGCEAGRAEKSAFDRAAQTEFTAEYDGHARATLPVGQDARARIAHGAKRALVARDPVTVTPPNTRLRIE